MSATDRLRELLDERGVEWKEHRHTLAGSMAIQRETLWSKPIDNTNGRPIPHIYHCRATEMGDGRLFLEAQSVTPEQAIEATIGGGDVRDEVHIARLSNGFQCDGSVWRCCKCGAFFTNYTDLTTHHKPRFCPNCGAKVVEK
uniref:Uncharacterized protein n=1 Tax=uncultured bacterium Contig1770 TaxID=1393510 RepID=W0FMP2_9BACT|nr:hypothetical protein [uncultured bacterium Contig1770]